jgi:hypothetical protein
MWIYYYIKRIFLPQKGQNTESCGLPIEFPRRVLSGLEVNKFMMKSSFLASYLSSPRRFLIKGLKKLTERERSRIRGQTDATDIGFWNYFENTKVRNYIYGLVRLKASSSSLDQTVSLNKPLICLVGCQLLTVVISFQPANLKAEISDSRFSHLFEALSS